MPTRICLVLGAALATLACGTSSSPDPVRGLGPDGAVGTGGVSWGPPKCVDACGPGDETDPVGLEERAGEPINQNNALPPPTVDAACATFNETSRVLETRLGSGTSFASPELAQAVLWQNLAPIPQLVRTQDFLNYFPPALPELKNTPEVPTIAARARQLGSGTEFDLLVVVKAPAVPATAQRVLVMIDDTASMGGLDFDTPLGRAKAMAAEIVTQAKGSDAKLTLRTATGLTLSSLDELQATTDETSLNGAVQVTLDAAADFQAGDRVFLITDGMDDVEELPRGALESAAKMGVRVNVIGTAKAKEHADRYFRAIARAGLGYYAYAGSDHGVTRTTGLLPQMFRTALYDVAVELSLPWYFETVGPTTEALVNLEDARQQDLASEGTQTYLFRLRACDKDLPVNTDYHSPVKISARYKMTPDGSYETADVPVVAFHELLQDGAEGVQRASAIFEVAEALKTLDRQRLLDAQAGLKAALAVMGGEGQDPELGTLQQALALHPLVATN